MVDDISEIIDFDKQMSKDEFSKTEILKDCKAEDLKEIATQSIILNAPIRKPRQITSMDGAFEIALSYEDFVEQQKSKDDHEFNEDKLVFQKLALISMAFPELKKQMEDTVGSKKQVGNIPPQSFKKLTKSQRAYINML